MHRCDYTTVMATSVRTSRPIVVWCLVVLSFVLLTCASAWAEQAPSQNGQGAAVEPIRSAGYRCPADNQAFWQEVKEAGWIGIGETWDFWTCDEGSDLFAEGANRGWKKMRPKRARMVLPGLQTAEEVRLYTTAIPYLALGPLALIFAFAWLFAFIMRRRFTPPTTVTCSECTTKVPIRDEEVGAFCPKCGAPMLIGDVAEAAS